MKYVCAYLTQNQIEIVNTDPMLSDFKYHFFLKQCYMPRKVKINEIAQNAHKGFNIQNLTSSSIYIIQIIKVYQDADIIDLAVGFRRDQIALKIARQVKQFDLYGRPSPIELAPGFKIFFDELKKQSEMDQEDMEIGMIKTEQIQPEKQDDEKSNKSRSRQKLKKRKSLVERLFQNDSSAKELMDSCRSRHDRFKCFLLFIPTQATRKQILDGIQDSIINSRDLTSYQWKKQNQIPYLELVLNRKNSYDMLLKAAGLKVNFYHILVMEETDKIGEKLLRKQALFTQKEKPTQNTFTNLISLINKLAWVREHGITIIYIIQVTESSFIVTFSHDFDDVEKLIFEGWTVEHNSNLSKFNQRPSSQKDLWYKYKSN